MNTLHDPRNGLSPFGRMVLLGLWALPAWAVLLFYGTFTHQPRRRPSSRPGPGMSPHLSSSPATPGRTRKHHGTGTRRQRTARSDFDKRAQHRLTSGPDSSRGPLLIAATVQGASISTPP